MRVLIVTLGSRGDVQPYLALGQGLQAAGHQVKVATHSNFRAFVEEHGLLYAPIQADMQELMSTDTGRRMWAAGANSALYGLRFFQTVRPLTRRIAQDCLAACRGADVVLGSLLGYWMAYSAAEKLNLPLHAAYLQPVHPTGLYPNAMFRPLPSSVKDRERYNRFSYPAFNRVLWLLAASMYNDARKTVLGMPPLHYDDLFGDLTHPEGPQVLYGYSRHVLPQDPAWPDRIRVTGFWYLDPPMDWQPPRELSKFLASGPPPVYVGFGSMSSCRPRETADTVVEALQMAGVRGVMLSGWAGLRPSKLPPTILQIDEAPHSWLFPQMAAVVHHGGAGTIAAALRAGVPQVSVPFSGDQPFWTHTIAELGVAPRPISHKRLNAERLAGALGEALGNPAIRRTAAEVGAKIRAEDGVTQAVEIVNRMHAGPLRSHVPMPVLAPAEGVLA
jgi:UDP:flavonoid glycosyltransferase YjiC (YdhE family)